MGPVSAAGSGKRDKLNTNDTLHVKHEAGGLSHIVKVLRALR